MIPWISFLTILPSAGGAEQHLLMSDILFLAVKEHAGKIRENEGTRTTTGDLATLTATSGKDMYLAKAKINVEATGLSNGTISVELKVKGVIKDTYDADLNHGTNPDSGNSADNYEFNMTALKVAATQIIKLEVISISEVAVNGSILCFEETTGESPFQTTEFS